MDQTRSIFLHWVASEPTASLWLAVVAVLLFGVTFSRLQHPDSQEQTWVHSLVGAFTKTLVFVLVTGCVYFLLTSGFNAFSQIYGSFTTGGSLSNQAWHEWENLYGGSFTQEDLQVTQSVPVETLTTIQPTDTSSPPLYQDVQEEQPISETSIVSFNGQVTMNINDPAKQTDLFNGYSLSALYEYGIVNPVDSVTHVQFRFPLSKDAKFYRDLSVELNGENVPDWQVVDGAIAWDVHMKPAEKDIVSIHYVTWAMDGYVFDVPAARQVTDFKLTVILDTDNC
jgi:hypothetical protein